jgi:pyrimidine operon attenuation protein/uracil phosphoribosyltransferase
LAPDRKTKRNLLDAAQMCRVIRRMAVELVERHRGVADLVLVGIRTRGVPLAEALGAEIEAMEGLRPPQGVLDITLYRDDLSAIAPQPVVKATRFPGPVDGHVLVLCDDVLFTGRTVRAALDALVDFGRPKKVELAVLVDRGRRELPIQADVVGLAIATSSTQVVEVAFEATDGRQGVWLVDGEEG